MSIGLTTSEFDRLSQFGEEGIDSYFGKLFVVRWAGLACHVQMVVCSHPTIATGAADNKPQNPADTVRERCFSAKASDLVFDDEVVEPQAGMEIAEPLSGGGYNVFRVLPRSNKRCWEPLDAEGVRILIYTKKIRTESE